MQDKQNIYFLHGLESSGNGTKGQYFGTQFPTMIRPDFTGTLAQRLKQLSTMCELQNDLVFVGSSFGGLMACCFTGNNREKVKRLILMAPALNFEDYSPPEQVMDVPTLLIIGQHDDVTPLDPVLGLAERTFSNLTIWICDDDHMLHDSFYQLEWEKLLNPAVELATLAPPAAILKSTEELARE